MSMEHEVSKPSFTQIGAEVCLFTWIMALVIPIARALSRRLATESQVHVRTLTA